MVELIIAAKIFSGRRRAGACLTGDAPPDRVMPPAGRGADSLLSPSRAVAFIIRASLFQIPFFTRKGAAL
jgi:hypothetical protein